MMRASRCVLSQRAAVAVAARMALAVAGLDQDRQDLDARERWQIYERGKGFQVGDCPLRSMAHRPRADCHLDADGHMQAALDLFIELGGSPVSPT